MKIPNVEATLSNGINFNLYSSLDRVPVLMNFIAGTWCPLCRTHISKLQKWKNKNFPNSVLIIVTPQKMENVQKWKDINSNSLIFLSDEDCKIAKAFDVKVPYLNFPLPASFLIDTDRSIKASYIGFKNKGHYETELESFLEAKKKGEMEVCKVS